MVTASSYQYPKLNSTRSPGIRGGKSSEKFLILSFLVCIILAMASLIYPTNVGNLAAVLTNISVVICTYMADDVFFFCLLPVFFLKITEIFPCLLIEFDHSLMWETGRTAYLTGATARLAFIDNVYWVAAYSFFKFARMRELLVIDKVATVPLDLTSVVVYLAACVMIAYLIGVGLSQGFPLLTGTERFHFKAGLGPLFGTALNNKNVFMVFFAWLNVYSKTKWPSYFLAFVILVLFMLFGEKFTSVGLAGFQFLGARFAVSGQRVSLKAWIIMAVVLFLITVPPTIYSYQAANLADSFDAFTRRIALQAQLWFLSDEYWQTGSGHFAMNAFVDEMKSFFIIGEGADSVSDVYADYGLYNVMRAFADPQVFAYDVKDGVGFIYALESGWLYSYGYILTTVLTCMSAFSYMVLVRLFIGGVSVRSPWMILLAAKAMTWNLNTIIVGYSRFQFGINVVALLFLGYAFSLMNSNIRSKRIVS